MRRYTADDEASIRTQALVRDWMRAGLLGTDQGKALESGLRVNLRRTGRMLRAGLALFTAIVIAAGVGLVMLTLDIDSAWSAGMFLALCGAGCFVAADRLAAEHRLYRYGIEETCAAAAVVLWAIATAIVMSEVFTSSREPFAFSTALAVTVVGSHVVYRRFGFRYAGVAAIAAATLLPFPLRLSVPVQRVAAAAIASGLFVLARRMRAAHPDDVDGDDAAVFEAAAFLAVYLTVNLHATTAWIGIGSSAAAVPWFRWSTYLLTWVLPAVGLWLAVRERDRPLLDAAGGALLITLVTNKAYLGLARQPWDPILLGVVLVAAALVIKRWLASGRNGERAGLTAVRLSRDEPDALRAIAVASSLNNPTADRPDTPAPSGFRGGRSGGGGGGADF